MTHLREKEIETKAQRVPLDNVGLLTKLLLIWVISSSWRLSSSRPSWKAGESTNIEWPAAIFCFSSIGWNRILGNRHQDCISEWPLVSRVISTPSCSSSGQMSETQPGAHYRGGRRSNSTMQLCLFNSFQRLIESTRTVLKSWSNDLCLCLGISHRRTSVILSTSAPTWSRFVFWATYWAEQVASSPSKVRYRHKLSLFRSLPVRLLEIRDKGTKASDERGITET